ncbi:MAG: prolyl oligopeptidase family serine peptidase [Bacteroides sp.]|jgi:prolyl oligopeptidase|nr:prolyl oligopeptidase family serine peptidase [Bacteroides sp.]
MKKSFLFVMSFSLIMLLASSCQRKTRVEYPETMTVDVVDDYFGVEVADPFRWLEDDNSPETKAWVEVQNAVTFSYLEKIPFREKINERLTEIWDYERFSTPFWKGNYYFFSKNDGMQNQSVLYVREGIDGEPRVLLDPNTMSEDGTIALTSLSISGDAQYLAYGISKGGSDWNEIFVRDIATGEDLDDHIQWVKFSGISWQDDGFYYSRYDAPKAGDELKAANEFQKVFYHKLGTLQEEDQLIYNSPDHPRRNYGARTTEDERFVILSESESTSGNAIYVKDNTQPNSAFIKVIEGFDFENGVVDNIGDKLLVLTNHSAPMYRLVLIDPKMSDPADWQVIIPESEHLLQRVTLVDGKIFAVYLEDVKSKVYIHDMEGQRIGELELPTVGSFGGFSGKKDESTAFFSFSSYTFPSTIYKYDAAANTYEVYFQPDIDFDPEAYETKQVFYPSKDGTMIPMFITHKKGLELNGKNPTLLYGYGGFNASMTPGFSVARLILLENGGVYAVANLRGGGEYGEAWHEAGTKLKKQNVFDDFIAAAEYLIAENYTSSERLAIQGGSNGGLLVGAVANQRPELFKVAFPAVGVMDMLRYHKFTIGWAWASDYGTSEDEEQFHNLYKYSPLHSIPEGVHYPATLVTTADHDDRVVPAHSFKYIAELQRKQAGDNPVLIRIETQAGHGAGKPVSKTIEELTDIYSFMFYNMDVKPKY